MIGPILGGRPPRLKIDSSLNLVCDGNSLTAGSGGYPWPRGLPLTSPFNTIYINGVLNPTVGTYYNIAIGGQTTRQMNGLDGKTADDVDACWMVGKTNVLWAWEGTNSLNNGRTVAQAVQDLVDYITARKALHPGWIIVIVTCLPRSNGSDAVNVTLNAAIDQYNAYLLANYRAMGAKAVIDVRQVGSPFNLPDYKVSTFENARATTGLWTDTGTDAVNYVTHLSDTGYHALTDQIIVPGLKRLPAR